jgi:hypothetical protein
MEYISINEAWEEYKSQIREPLANLRQLERVFRDGYIRGFDKREQKQQLIELMNSEIQCTGNNGNGCFMDSCGHNCGCVGVKEIAQKLKTEQK